MHRFTFNYENNIHRENGCEKKMKITDITFISYFAIFLLSVLNYILSMIHRYTHRAFVQNIRYYFFNGK